MIVDLLKLLVICWCLKDLASFFGEIISDVKVKNKILNVLLLLISYILTCSDKCFPFWLSLILSGDLFTSALVSIIVNSASNIQYKYQKTEL